MKTLESDLLPFSKIYTYDIIKLFQIMCSCSIKFKILYTQWCYNKKVCRKKHLGKKYARKKVYFLIFFYLEREEQPQQIPNPFYGTIMTSTTPQPLRKCVPPHHTNPPGTMPTTHRQAIPIYISFILPLSIYLDHYLFINISIYNLQSITLEYYVSICASMYLSFYLGIFPGRGQSWSTRS